MNCVVLISGNGSNLQAIIDNTNKINIKCVISDNKDAFGLQRAALANIATKIITANDKTKAEFNNELLEFIATLSPKLIILAGFMRILPTQFIKQYSNKIINIHPSLLPKFKGLNTHKQALEAQEKQHGASVHFVNEKLDSGAIIAQRIVNITANDTVQSLAKKVLIEEHKLYPEVISWFIDNRLKLIDNTVYLDGNAIF